MLADSYMALYRFPDVALLMPALSLPRILIADESLAVQAQLAETLASDAEVVSVVRRGQLAAWLDHPALAADVLLLERDFIRQDLDGFCRRWQQNPASRGCDLVLMGEADDDTEIQALAMGAQDYLRKPLNPLLLQARIKRLLAVRQQLQQLRAQTTTDGLTQVANRRYLDEFLAAEWRRAQRQQGDSLRGIGLIMADLDHFKLYNDHYGHPAGDECLRRVAAALKHTARRPRDLVARYGGEEFAVVLPSIAVAGVEVVAQRLQQAVAALEIAHPASPTHSWLTLSMGLAWCEPAPGEALGLLLEAADEALYSAKAAGRNRYSATVDLAVVRSLLSD